jgi:hypothetical protein
MPRYDWRHTGRDPLAERPTFRVDAVLDANSKVLLSHIFWLDTDTGEIGRYDFDSNSRIRRTPDGKLLCIFETHPAPLRIVMRDEADTSFVVGEA